ncbi:MAG TPA: hypothetical protein VG674_33415 [Amycolatopsis sp.]|nr:hypothetical protein [Amycolatopsis sp.]
MLRTAERRASSLADELLDRTGIVAASLPRARRSPEETQPIPVVNPTGGDRASTAELASARSRTARRRARVWLACLGGAGLLALGWLAGGVFAGPAESADTVAAPAGDNVAPPPAAVPAPAPPAAPVTVYVPVPDHQPAVVRHETTRPTTTARPAAPEHKASPSTDEDVARTDTTSDTTATRTATAAELDQYLARWKPWIELAHRMSGRR